MNLKPDLPYQVRRKKTGPEADIQEDIVKMMLYRGWYVKETHGSIYQTGLPDLYCAHRKYGPRWVEVKNPLNFRFQPSQLEEFPKLMSVGVGVWILVAATEFEYLKLFARPNWHTFLNHTGHTGAIKKQAKAVQESEKLKEEARIRRAINKKK